MPKIGTALSLGIGWTCTCPRGHPAFRSSCFLHGGALRNGSKDDGSAARGTPEQLTSDANQNRQFDAIIRGGQLVDGSGGVPRPADVGIRGEAIAAIGDLADATAGRSIDARAQSLTLPGELGDSSTHH